MNEQPKPPMTEVERLKNEAASLRATMNGFLFHIQELDGEKKMLVMQRAKQDERIEMLERKVRNQQREVEYLTRRERLAQHWLDLTAQVLSDLGTEIERAEVEDPANALSVKLRDWHQRVSRYISPQTSLHIVDFAIQLRKWSTDDAEFQKKLKDMGFGEYEQITVDLTQPLVLEDIEPKKKEHEDLHP
jgi:hypothetical protein